MAAPPRLLIVDVDGVLYDYDRDVRVRALAAALNVEPQAVDDALFASGIEDRADAGELSTDEYLDAVGAQLGCRVDRETWVQARIVCTKPMPGELELTALAATSAQAVTLSNNSLLLKEEMPRIMPELVALPGVTIHVAAEFGVLKPDPAVYLAIAEHYGVRPGDTAFVDDAERHVKGAERAGMAAHHYRNLDGYRAWLADLDLLKP